MASWSKRTPSAYGSVAAHARRKEYSDRFSIVRRFGTKKDLSTLESLKEKDEFTGVLLGFNIAVSADLADYAKAKGLRLITNEVIYKIIEDYEKYVSNLKKKLRSANFPIWCAPVNSLF